MLKLKANPASCNHGQLFIIYVIVEIGRQTFVNSWFFHFLLQSIMSYNGAAVIGMAGKDCVAIAADTRFGIQAQTVGTDFQKVFEMGPHLYLGLPGLATDVQTVWVFMNFLWIQCLVTLFGLNLQTSITWVVIITFGTKFEFLESTAS